VNDHPSNPDWTGEPEDGFEAPEDTSDPYDHETDDDELDDEEREEQEQVFASAFQAIARGLAADGVGVGGESLLDASAHDHDEDDAHLYLAFVFYGEQGETYSVADFIHWLQGDPGEPCRVCGAPDPTLFSTPVLKVMKAVNWLHHFRVKVKLAWKVLRVRPTA
jgi:hypothetical protein